MVAGDCGAGASGNEVFNIGPFRDGYSWHPRHMQSLMCLDLSGLGDRDPVVVQPCWNRDLVTGMLLPNQVFRPVGECLASMQRGPLLMSPP